MYQTKHVYAATHLMSDLKFDFAPASTGNARPAVAAPAIGRRARAKKLRTLRIIIIGKFQQRGSTRSIVLA